MGTFRISFFLFTLFALPSANGIAASCPWSNVDDVLKKNQKDRIGTLKTLTIDEIKEDLACVKFVMENTHATTEVYKTKGVDLPARIEKLSLAINSNMNQKELLEKLHKLHTDAPDLHSGYYFHSDQGQNFSHTSPILTPYVMQNSNGNIAHCKGFSQFKTATSKNIGKDSVLMGQLEGDHHKDTLCVLKDGSTVIAPIKKIDLTQLETNAKTLHNKKIGDVTYLRIPGFTSLDPANVKKITDSLLVNDEKLLIDLRQTGGGLSDTAFLFLKSLLGKSTKLQAGEVVFNVGPLGLAGFVNEMKHWHILAKAKGDPNADVIMQEIAKYEGQMRALEPMGFTFVNPVKMQFPQDAYGARPQPMNSKIAILIDKRCGSACEIIPFYAQHMNEITSFGAPTVGLTNFGTPGQFILPNSKIIFRASLVKVLGAVPEETKGALPNYLVTDGDPMGAALHYLNQ